MSSHNEKRQRIEQHGGNQLYNTPTSPLKLPRTPLVPPIQHQPHPYPNVDEKKGNGSSPSSAALASRLYMTTPPPGPPKVCIFFFFFLVYFLPLKRDIYLLLYLPNLFNPRLFFSIIFNL
jgi:hypothetical protein